MESAEEFRITAVGLEEGASASLSLEQHLEHARLLFREYQEWLKVDLCFQGFEQEMASLPGRYAPPQGRLLLAYSASGDVAGCVGLRPLDRERGEIKRLWVRDAYKGLGLGRTLLEAAIQEARAIGYHHVLLDTLPKMEAALHLYESMGFRETWPYTHNPEPGVMFLSKELR
jgi:ribosomal protein S18 acetylase RimI-like enzyme